MIDTLITNLFAMVVESISELHLFHVLIIAIFNKICKYKIAERQEVVSLSPL